MSKETLDDAVVLEDVVEAVWDFCVQYKPKAVWAEMKKEFLVERLLNQILEIGQRRLHPENNTGRE